MEPLREIYLDLLKKTLTNSICGDAEHWPIPWEETDGHAALRDLKEKGLQLTKRIPFDPAARLEGRDWPPTAHTMIGLKRLDNLQFCIEDVLARGVPGDLMETGVWRGGASIFMRGVLKAHGVGD